MERNSKKLLLYYTRKGYKHEKKLDSQLTRYFYEDGIDFSGGERQKLSIARALIKDSEMIFFDEPSSSLDPISECELYEIIKNFDDDKIVLFVSLRLSSVFISDRILFFKDGKIHADGKHEVLLISCEEYKRLFDTTITVKSK